MKAYIFANVDGDPLATAKRIGALRGVVDADATTGPFDVIAGCEADDVAELCDVITEIQQVPGVEHTTTRVVISTPDSIAAQKAA